MRDLNTHKMQKHTGERPHICNLCGKGFVHKHYLAEHMDYHTDERKYQCQQCGKRFQSASTLSKHAERHKGQRSHQCPHCSKAFMVHVDLRSHVRYAIKYIGSCPVSVKFGFDRSLQNSHLSQNLSQNLIFLIFFSLLLQYYICT